MLILKKIKEKNNYAYFGFFIVVFLLSVYYIFTKILPTALKTKSKVEYCLIFDDIKDLSVGAGVTVAGVRVGYVKDISLYKGKAKVVIAINKNIKLTNNTKAYITSSSLLGNYYIALDIKPGSPLPPEVCLRNTSSETIIDSFNNLAENFSKLNITQINLLLSSTQKLVKDLDKNQNLLTNQLNKTLENLNKNLYLLTKSSLKVLNETSQNLKTLNKTLVSTAETYRKLGKDFDKLLIGLSKNLEESLENINLALKNINYLLYQAKRENIPKEFKDVLKETKNSLVILNKILLRLYNSNGTLWKVVEDDSLYKNLNNSLSKLNILEERIETVFPKNYDFIPKFSFYLTNSWKIRYSLLGEFKFTESALEIGFTQIDDQPKLDFVYSKYLTPRFAIKTGIYEGDLALGGRFVRDTMFLDSYVLPFLEIKLGKNIGSYQIYLGERYKYKDKIFETLIGGSISFQ